MAKTESAASIVSGQTTSTTTSAVSVAGSYGTGVGVSIVQVGTATTAATWTLQVSYDGGTTWYDHAGPVAAGLPAATYSWTAPVPLAASHVRIVYVQQAGGTSSTLSAQVGTVAIS